MAKDTFEDLTPTVVRMVLQTLIAKTLDSKKRVQKESLIYVTFDDVRCLAAAEQWLDQNEIKLVEQAQEIQELRATRKALRADIERLERGGK